MRALPAVAAYPERDMLLLAELAEQMSAPSYRPKLFPPAEIARYFNVTRAAVTNWGARTATTGVQRYGSRYDLNEVQRWMIVRDHDVATRRRMLGSVAA